MIKARRISIGVVGAGYITNLVHLPTLSRLPEANVVAICDQDLEKARAAAQRSGIPRVYSSLEEMLSRERPDLVDVCVPPHRHKDVLITALEHGVNCLMEEPLSVTTADADTIIALAQEKGVSLHVIHNFSVLPGILKAKALIGKGGIGQVTGVDIKYLAPLEPAYLDPNHWVHGLSGGYFSECGTHLTMLLVEFLGEFHEVRAMASKASDHPQIRMDELRIVARCGAALGTITCSLNCPSRLLPVDIFGTKGALYVNGDYQAVVRYGPLGSAQDTFARGRRGVRDVVTRAVALGRTAASVLGGRYAAQNHGHYYLIPRSLRALQGKGSYPIDIHDAREAVRLLEMALEQIQNPRPTKVKAENG